MEEVHSAGGVVERDNKIVVVSQLGVSWSLPKGHVDEGENIIDTAKREIYEETGIKNLEFVKDLGSYKRCSRVYTKDNGDEECLEMKTITLFHFKTDQKNLCPIDSHNPEAKWVEKDKVNEVLTHPKDKEFFLKIKNKL